MSETQFQGFDWTELYEPLTGKPYPEGVMGDEEAKFADEIRDVLGRAVFTCNDTQEAEQARIVGICRDFLRAIAAFDGYEKPLVEGLIAVEHNETFLRYMDPLLEYLWT
jgi:hypothetical protein